MNKKVMKVENIRMNDQGGKRKEHGLQTVKEAVESRESDT